MFSFTIELQELKICEKQEVSQITPLVCTHGRGRGGGRNLTYPE